MMRAAVLCAIVAGAFAAALTSLPLARDVPDAHACTGGMGRLDDYAVRADQIFIGTAVEIGDEVNRAPTITATATASMTPTVSPTATSLVDLETAVPSATSTPQPVRTPVSFDLSGIGANLAVDQMIAGDHAERIGIYWESREYIELELRWHEAHPHSIVSCPIGIFTPRLTLGAQYLVFLTADIHVEGILRVDGEHVRLDDEGLREGYQGRLTAKRPTYERYLVGFDAEMTEGRAYATASITAPSVPLSTVLRAVAGLRGEERSMVTPPVTGNAGLKAASP